YAMSSPRPARMVSLPSSPEITSSARDPSRVSLPRPPERPIFAPTPTELVTTMSSFPLPALTPIPGSSWLIGQSAVWPPEPLRMTHGAAATITAFPASTSLQGEPPGHSGSARFASWMELAEASPFTWTPNWFTLTETWLAAWAAGAKPRSTTMVTAAMICLVISPSSLERELDDLIAPGAGEGGQVAALTGHAGEPLRRPVSLPQPKRDLPSELALCVAGLEAKDAL